MTYDTYMIYTINSVSQNRWSSEVPYAMYIVGTVHVIYTFEVTLVIPRSPINNMHLPLSPTSTYVT